MDDLKNILAKKKFETCTTGRPANQQWEQAKMFLEYLGIKPERSTIIFVLQQCKKHGAGKVYGLQSYLKDAKYDTDRFKGLIVWKLNGGTFKK